MTCWRKLLDNFLVLVVLVVVLLFSQNCAAQDESLELRAKAWVELLHGIEGVGREQAILKLSEFLEPSAATKVRAEEYYLDWSKSNQNWKTLAASVDEVMISRPDGVGKVRITAVVLNQENGDKKTVSQETRWRLVNKKWYRVIVRSQVVVNK